MLVNLSGRGDKDVAPGARPAPTVSDGSPAATGVPCRRPVRARPAGGVRWSPAATPGTSCSSRTSPAGWTTDWLLTVEALAGAGADAIEVGIPFSDPMIDGPTIQEASLRALGRGTTPDGILADLSRIDVGIPLVVMTYYNLIYRAGHDRIAGLMAESGVAGRSSPTCPWRSWDRGPTPPTRPGWPPCSWWRRRRPPDGSGRRLPALPRLRLRRGPDGSDR